ncbi:microtubule-associated protein 6 homolog [Corythoichthys intestinalis]|uniref:microtubule-associated protein 6 homolog n=1 Tax=Corythoichthys intestinalis TaxID=161448 RepID=UPI0025A61A7A|nr:microtubule-associated protein 6 homolog [Corythoichthys intestinalis]XP_061797865.1 microtubule-associated protein 6 homolog [Nerophis lumbriciformis]
MAWPCITRACCINRFWSELDKADIAVPLVFTKYSDVQQKQPKRAPAEGRPESQPEAAKAPPAAASDASSSVMRQDFKAWKVRPEPSCKPRNEYQPAAGPFIPETQYQKDYKAWPIPKKHDHPWIPKAGLAPPTGSSGSTAAAGKMELVSAEIDSGVEKSELEEKLQEKEVKEPAKRDKSADRKGEEAPSGKGRAAADALNRHIKQTLTASNSSYRSEFKAYKDVKPVKPIKAPSQYKPPAENESNLETSYSATFRGEQVKAQPADNKLLERRRIRSLYSEPAKETHKADKPASRVRPKKATTTKTVKKAKENKEKKLLAASAKKKEEEAEAGVTKKNKELSNRLAEAKQ